MTKQNTNEYVKYEVIDREGELVKSYKHYGWAYKFANKLAIEGMNVEIVGINYDSNFDEIRKTLIGC